jgi:hypothetical protein
MLTQLFRMMCVMKSKLFGKYMLEITCVLGFWNSVNWDSLFPARTILLDRSSGCVVSEKKAIVEMK